MNWRDTRFGRLVANSLSPRRPSVLPRLGVCLCRSFVRLFVPVRASGVGVFWPVPFLRPALGTCSTVRARGEWMCVACGISAVELCRSCVRLFVPSVFGHRAGDRGSRESRGAGDVDLAWFLRFRILVTFLCKILFLRWAQTPKDNPLMLGRVMLRSVVRSSSHADGGEDAPV